MTAVVIERGGQAIGAYSFCYAGGIAGAVKAAGAVVLDGAGARVVAVCGGGSSRVDRGIDHACVRGGEREGFGDFQCVVIDDGGAHTQDPAGGHRYRAPVGNPAAGTAVDAGVVVLKSCICAGIGANRGRARCAIGQSQRHHRARHPFHGKHRIGRGLVDGHVVDQRCGREVRGGDGQGARRIRNST